MPPKAVSSYCEQQVNVSNDFVDHISRLTEQKAILDDFLPEIYKFATEGELMMMLFVLMTNLADRFFTVIFVD